MPDPRHHVFAYVDMEGSSKLTGPQKVRARADLAAMLERACSRAGIPEADKGDRGDGALLVSESVVPIRAVIDGFAAELDGSLAARAVGDIRMRLRLIVHQGDLDRDEDGWSGHELDRAARMVDAPEIKTALRATADGRIALVVAPEVYHNVVRGYETPAPAEFRMRRVTTQEGPVETWLTITGAAEQPGRPADEAESPRKDPAVPVQSIGGDHWNVQANNSTIGRNKFGGGIRYGADRNDA